MNLENVNPRERILDATRQLINERPNPQTITIRQIAKRAGVAIGLINYHFQSKDNLIKEAIVTTVGILENLWQQSAADLEGDARIKLKKLMKINAKVGTDNPEHAQILIKHILLDGEFDVPLVILPLLREIYGDEKSEQEQRTLALALIVTVQVAFIRYKAFWRYLGVDLFDEDQREMWMDNFVDLLVN